MTSQLKKKLSDPSLIFQEWAPGSGRPRFLKKCILCLEAKNPRSFRPNTTGQCKTCDLKTGTLPTSNSSPSLFTTPKSSPDRIEYNSTSPVKLNISSPSSSPARSIEESKTPLTTSSDENKQHEIFESYNGFLLGCNHLFEKVYAERLTLLNTNQELQRQLLFYHEVICQNDDLRKRLEAFNGVLAQNQELHKQLKNQNELTAQIQKLQHQIRLQEELARQNDTLTKQLNDQIKLQNQIDELQQQLQTEKNQNDLRARKEQALLIRQQKMSELLQEKIE